MDGAFKKTRKKIKRPMMLMSVTAGLIGGIQGSLMRGMTLSFTLGGMSWATFTYLLVGIFSGCIQLYCLNVVMLNYEQLDATPTYQSSLILLNILCSIVVLDEKQVYTWSELILLLFYAKICILGVYIIVHKPNVFYINSWKNEESEMEEAPQDEEEEPLVTNQ